MPQHDYMNRRVLYAPRDRDGRLTNFLTHQLISRVATVDVELIVGISNATSNLVMREKKNEG